MKKLVFLFFAFPSLALSQEFVEPILSAQQINEISKNYLIKNKIELDEFTLESISFNYLQDKNKKNYWQVMYWGKPNKDGSVDLGKHFGIRLTNKKEPEIEFIPGL